MIRPYIATASTSFVTVKGDGFPSKGFFQAFLAAEKGHPIIHRSLKIMLEYLKKKNEYLLGPMALMDAWIQIENITNATSDQERNGAHLLMEVNYLEHKETQYKPLRIYMNSTEGYQAMFQRVPSHFGDRCQFSGGEYLVSVRNAILCLASEMGQSWMKFVLS